jgi:hypothetical protein
MWGTFLILFCLFAGLGEYMDAYGWLRAGEDMCRLLQNLIFSRDSATSSLQHFPALFNNPSLLCFTSLRYIYIYICHVHLPPHVTGLLKFS